MNRKEQDKKAKEVSEKFRAEILIFSVDSERILTDMIISRFEKKPLEKIDYILYFEKTSFERKIHLVKLILKSNYPKLLGKYKKTFIQLDQMRDIRNALSHYNSYYENDGKKTVFVLGPNIVRLRKKKKGGWIEKNVKKFSVRHMKGLIKMVEKCNTDIRKLETEL